MNMAAKDYRSSPEFLLLQQMAKEAQDKLDEVLREVAIQFPPKDGCYWSVNHGGTLGQYHPVDYD